MKIYANQYTYIHIYMCRVCFGRLECVCVWYESGTMHTDGQVQDTRHNKIHTYIYIYKTTLTYFRATIKMQNGILYQSINASNEFPTRAFSSTFEMLTRCLVSYAIALSIRPLTLCMIGLASGGASIEPELGDGNDMLLCESMS